LIDGNELLIDGSNIRMIYLSFRPPSFLRVVLTIRLPTDQFPKEKACPIGSMFSLLLLSISSHPHNTTIQFESYEGHWFEKRTDSPGAESPCPGSS
jgi:hypothetical protein